MVRVAFVHCAAYIGIYHNVYIGTDFIIASVCSAKGKFSFIFISVNSSFEVKRETRILRNVET